MISLINSREKIDVLRGGRVIESAVLSRNCPRAAFYVELREAATTLSAGKTKKRAEIEANQRAARTFFDAAAKRINKIAQEDLPAAEELTNELLHFLIPEKAEKEKPGRAVSGDPHEKEIRALCSLLSAAEAVLSIFGNRLDKFDPDCAPNLMAAVEAPLAALALDDPEAATKVYKASEFFDEGLEPNEIYLGPETFADRSILEVYDTPEKRAAYIAGIWKNE